MAPFTSATTFLIENSSILFALPEKLKTKVQSFNFARGSEGRRSLAQRSKQGGPGVACLIANTVFSFIEKENDDDEVQEENEKESNDVCDNLENTVMSQFNLNLHILNMNK